MKPLVWQAFFWSLPLRVGTPFEQEVASEQEEEDEDEEEETDGAELSSSGVSAMEGRSRVARP